MIYTLQRGKLDTVFFFFFFGVCRDRCLCGLLLGINDTINVLCDENFLTTVEATTTTTSILENVDPSSSRNKNLEKKKVITGVP